MNLSDLIEFTLPLVAREATPDECGMYCQGDALPICPNCGDDKLSTAVSRDSCNNMEIDAKVCTHCGTIMIFDIVCIDLYDDEEDDE